MASQKPGTHIDETGLWLPPGLHLSFQRYAAPASGAAPCLAPASLGLLPLAESSEGTLLLPLANGEAFWIGLGTPTERAVRLGLSVVGRDGKSSKVAPREVKAYGRIAGCAGQAFTYDAVRCLRFETNACTTVVNAVDHEGFTAATGRPAPSSLDPSSGYGGWRLP